MENEFKNYLQAELVRRCRSNPRYSLRAFAKNLGAEPSFLSKILNGKRTITPESLARFGAKLQLSGAELARYSGALGHAAQPGYVSLAPEQFRVISEWQHYAILELLRVPGFALTDLAVSRRLGISRAEAKDAITRLRDLGMLPKSLGESQSRKSQPRNHTTVGGPDTALAFRALQRQILEKALRALEETPVEERDQSSITMAVDRRQLPEIRRRIKAFRRSLDRFAQSKGRPDSVYHLSISFYPVTQLQSENRGKKP